jgi:hypothetical protein
MMERASSNTINKNMTNLYERPEKYVPKNKTRRVKKIYK